MARAFPVPLYTTATQIGGSADKRALSLNNPNAESSASGKSVGLGNFDGALRPEQIETSNIAVSAVGSIRAVGYGLLINDIAPESFSTITVDAGSWTIPVHYSRPGSVLTGNITVDEMTVVLSRVSGNPSAGAALQEIGRTVNATTFTVTTTEQSRNIVVAGAQAIFNPGERLWMEVFFHCPVHVLSDTLRWHTQSATALRISAAPAFTVQYSRGLADAPSASDALVRSTVYARGMSDSSAVSDALDRDMLYVRALADNAPASDALSRQATYGRALADAPAVSDTLFRQTVYARALADSAALTDSLARQAAYGRALADSAPVSDGLTRVVTANRSLADSAPVADQLVRTATYSRALEDSSAVVDTLARQMIYSRGLLDELSEGGGTTYPDGLLRLRPDGRIESVNANVGALPPGALRITTVP